MLYFFMLPANATPLGRDTLVSTGCLYLHELEQAEQLSQEPALGTPKRKVNLHLEYAEQYDRTLLTLGELDVERLITLNGGGKDLNISAFELGFHIAVNYTPGS
jgi:hypothetical protein